MEGLKKIFRNEIIERGKNILYGLDHGKWDTILREVHTLKGTSRMMGFTQMGDVFQKIENILKSENVPLEEKRRIARKIGEVVSTGDIDNLVHSLTGIISKEDGESKSMPRTTSVSIDDIIRINNLFTQILYSNDIEEARKLAREGLLHSTSILLYPIKPVIKNIVKRAKKHAEKLGKKVEFIISGRDINVDRRITEELIGPITHILNNSIDHGIEMPDERKDLGKKETGTIEITLTRSEHSVEIEITDDGAGLDLEKIRTRGKEMGLSLPPEELIFYDGFTTKEERDTISGMGVGLSSVRSTIRKMGGNVKVESQPGRFTKFKIIVPLMLATSRVFLFSLDNNLYALHENIMKRVFREDKNFFMETKNGITIPFDRFLGIKEVVIQNLPEVMEHPAYQGYFVYEGNPCLVIEPVDFSMVQEVTVLTKPKTGGKIKT